MTCRIFIGTEPKTYVMMKVLENSIRMRSSVPVNIVPMIGGVWEYSTEGIKVGTGFSLRRWLIPEFCQWEGRAIYMDADQIVLADVADLWNFPDQEPSASCSAWMTYQPDKFQSSPWPQSSVMVIDCAAASQQWGWKREEMLANLRGGATKDHYAKFMHAAWMTPQPGRLPTEWNHLNVYKPGKTKLLHYTKEPQQPIYVPDGPLADLWHKELKAAMDKGVVTKSDISEGLARWKTKEDWRNQNGLHPFYRKYLK